MTDEQVDFYGREGYIMLPGAFSRAEMKAASDEADALLAREELLVQNNLRTRWKPDVRSGQPVFDVFDPVFDVAPVLKGIGLDRRILDPLAALYGEPACQFKDKLIYKAPGALGATLHQDWIAWPTFPKSFVTVIVAIDPFTAENGCTVVYPRSHGNGYLSPMDGNHHHLETRQFGSPDPVPLILEPGDLAIFGCFTPHSSAPNHTDRWRRGLFVSYNAASEGGQQRDAHYEEYNVWRSARIPADAQTQLVYR